LCHISPLVTKLFGLGQTNFSVLLWSKPGH
jgi:hypothetical protein